MAAAAQPAQLSAVPGPMEGAHAAPGAETAERALVPAGHKLRTLDITPDTSLGHLPVELEVGVPLRDFRVRNLLALAPGVVVASRWNHGDDLPLSTGDVQLAWAQFEVLETVLSARLTRVA